MSHIKKVFKIESEQQSKELQESLFKQGYKWWGHSNEVINHVDKPFLFISTDGTYNITFREHLNGCKEYEEADVKDYLTTKKREPIFSKEELAEIIELWSEALLAWDRDRIKEIKKEWPQKGDTCFHVEDVISSRIWNNNLVGKDAEDIMHNIFKTYEEARHYQKWLEDPVTNARYKLQKFAEEYNGDWESEDFIGWEYATDKSYRASFHCAGAIVMKDKEGWKKAIEALGEDVITLACGITK